MHLVGFYYKSISRCTVLWVSKSLDVKGILRKSFTLMQKYYHPLSPLVLRSMYMLGLLQDQLPGACIPSCFAPPLTPIFCRWILPPFWCKYWCCASGNIVIGPRVIINSFPVNFVFWKWNLVRYLNWTPQRLLRRKYSLL